ncbi:hypothetical protein AVEN_218173-1 [Araneus ventricosus]|uniref:Uncharacterized protein n=1 Tax=Araneus ventricosus TaxID=182803 RepID=A0A4Y2WG27_ARAVE|nr:hypothetical protein AVEN_215669-1 [Araneus ventricosus]GBO35963.1 hypothetical protein AVEN_218173-1 [Araneus ventricosus]
MFGEMITWFRHEERDGHRAASIKVQRVTHFPTGTTICMIEIEALKEAGQGSMASGDLNYLPGSGCWDVGDLWFDIMYKASCFAFIPVCLPSLN